MPNHDVVRLRFEFRFNKQLTLCRLGAQGEKRSCRTKCVGEPPRSSVRNVTNLCETGCVNLLLAAGPELVNPVSIYKVFTQEVTLSVSIRRRES
jgi:hypothetical protein